MSKKFATSTDTNVNDSSIAIRPCRCSHKWQDERYGKGNRVFNRNMKDKTKNEAVCTVCGTRKTLK